MKQKEKTKRERKQYFTGVSRKYVYGGLAAFAVVAMLLFLTVPHYKPLNYADAQETTDANREIIHGYFVKNTDCKNDNREKTDRIKTFNKYFQTNEFANRAVFRGCNDKDVLLALDDERKWQKVDIQLDLDRGQPEDVKKACLTEEIVKTAKLYSGMSSKSNIGNKDQHDRDIHLCNKLAKESYIEVNFKQGIELHF